MDAATIVALLDGILSTGSQPIAILSILLNVYLWRAYRASEKTLMESRLEEIERMRAELAQLRRVDQLTMRELEGLTNVVKEQTDRGGAAGPRRRSGRAQHDPD